jgi:hypothetical protein
LEAQDARSSGATRLKKALVGRTKKHWWAGQRNRMMNDEWEELDTKAIGTIRLCLENEVMFNIIGEDTTISLWSRLESLYMMKSLTNIIFLKKKLYSLRMKEGTRVVDHLNT